MRGETHIDYTNKRFGKLIAIEYIIGSKWKCKCDCGNITIVRTCKLTTGHTKSCGCLRHEKYNLTHGLRKTRLYRIWANMKTRCYNSKDPHFKRWGGRGISICDEWRNNFKSFYDWAIYNGYKYNLTIDRIDNNGNYEPSNCRWASIKEQNQNKSNVKRG